MGTSSATNRFTSPEAAEAAFYQAFAQCDLRAMEAVWVEDENVVCIHPGSAALLGREQVMRSWSNILLNAQPPDVRINVLSRTVSDALAVHVVEEYITPSGAPNTSVSLVLATNIYCKSDHDWRLLEHHASVPRTVHSAIATGSQSKPTLQ